MACLYGFNHVQEGQKLNLVGIMLVMVIILMMTYQRQKVHRFLAGHCPLGRMSCIGGFKRNVLSFNQTYIWLMYKCFSSMITTLIYQLSVVYSKELTPNVQFWIWNIGAFASCEGVYLVLPFLLEAPNNDDLPREQEFYTRHPVLEPRRPSNYLTPQTLLIIVISAPDSGSRFIYQKEYQSTTYLERPQETLFHHPLYHKQ